MAEEESDGAKLCYQVLHVNSSNESWTNVFNAAKSSNFDVTNYQDLVEGDNDSSAFHFSNVLLDASDQRSENVHTQDSAALMLVMLLLFLTVITIWVFKVKRFRVMHETGLAMMYGELLLNKQTHIPQL